MANALGRPMVNGIKGIDVEPGQVIIGPGTKELIFLLQLAFDADLVLQDAIVIDNRIGLEVSGDSYLETTGTDICDNGRNLDLHKWVLFPRFSPVPERSWLERTVPHPIERLTLRRFRSGDELVPLDLDVHPIPARGDEPRHDHWDVRFLLRAEAGQQLVMSDESHDLRWFAADEVTAVTTEESVLRLHHKAARLS